MSRDATLTKIAADTLGIETLEIRKSDGLDFHDVAALSVKEALEAAYEAGRADVDGDLLSALQRILAAHDSGNNGVVMGEAVLCRAFAEQARAAIAKATGQ